MSIDKNQTGQTAADKNVAALSAKVLILEAENKRLIAQYDETVKLLKQSNDLIEMDTKAQLVKDASEVSAISLPELAGMDIEGLETIISVSKQVRPTKFESGGDVAAPRADKFDSRTHLHSKYVGNRKE